MSALFNQETDYKFEVIVVDGNSDDVDSIKEKYKDVIWLSSSVRNPYTSRNLGILRAAGKVLAFIDAKCTPCISWVDTGISSLLEEDKKILAGHYEVKPQSSELKDLLYGLLYLNNEKNVRYNYGVTTGNLWVHKSAFDLVGLFCEEHISGNDIAWSRKAMSLDYEIVFKKEAAVDYPGQSYDQLCHSIPKYMSGIAHQHHIKLSKTERTVYFIKNLLPLRLKTFTELITYRQLNNISTIDKCYLWLLAWLMKMKMAKAYLVSSFS